MRARVLPLTSDEHRTAQELLPWLVNGSLDAAEAAQVTEHLAHCSVCQADAAAQAQLRAVPLDGFSRGDVDRDWAALRSKLDLASNSPGRRAATARPWWSPGLQLAVAVQAAVILVFAIAFVAVLTPVEPYRALGANAAADANALAVFRAEATHAQMSAALRAAGARIVGGPTVTDAYLLRLPDTSPDTLGRLRAQPGVLTVESLQGEPVR